MNQLKVKVVFDGKVYNMRFVVEAPRETADLILQLVHRTLSKKGILVND
jgi:hypothetical protein